MEPVKTDEAARIKDILLYRSNGVSPLRVLTVVALAFAVGSALLAALLLDTAVELSGIMTFRERLIWAVGLFAVFSGFFLAVWMYERRVAASLVLARGGEVLRLTTPTLFGMQERDIPVSALINSQYYDGDQAGEEATSPPWLWVKVRGHSSFFVPLSGLIPNKERLLRVLSATR